jgi:hypothetical protein
LTVSLKCLAHPRIAAAHDRKFDGLEQISTKLACLQCEERLRHEAIPTGGAQATQDCFAPLAKTTPAASIHLIESGT